MAIRQVVTFIVKPGTAEAFIAGFEPIVRLVRNEPGCEQYEMYQSLDEPERLVFLERWTDQASLDAALQRNYHGPDDPALAFLQHLEGQPVRERYEVE